MRHSVSLRPLARCSGHPRPSRVRHQCTVGVLAGTHWGDDSSRVLSHQSANPLWLCRANGHGRDRGRELSCGLFMWTSFIQALFKDTSSARESGCRAYDSFLVELVFACFVHCTSRVHVDVRARELEVLGIRGVSRHRPGPVRPDSSRARAPSPR